MKKSIACSMLLWGSLCFPSWTVFIYMNSTDSLSDMTYKALRGLMKVGSDEQLTLAVQIHSYGNKALRGVIKPDSFAVSDYVTLSMDQENDILDAAHWAFEKHPADHTMVIFWGHGFGILDPQWNAAQEEWSAEPDTSSGGICPIKRSLRHHHTAHRGFLFNLDPRSYLTSRQIGNILATIATDILHKKIDIVAFDTCMGAMLELAYQHAPYANYQIGSENCELKDGWHYKPLAQAMKDNRSPYDVAQAAVAGFKHYYIKHTQEEIYTLSAIDCQKAVALTQALNTFAHLISLASDEELAPLKNLLNAARNATPGFCFVPMYRDIITYFENLSLLLNSQPNGEFYEPLIATSERIKSLAQEAVIANCSGSAIAATARGISFYYPTVHIDSSYSNSVFAQETAWYNFLKTVC